MFFFAWETSQKYQILLQVVCGSGAILVIFSNFSIGQPKTHFLTHLVNSGHEGGSNMTQIT